MQIEQRLGRLHRIGQHHDVELTNLVTAGTIDDHLLHVLETKINLFELVVGEFATRLAELGDALVDAREGYLASRHATDALVGDPA